MVDEVENKGGFRIRYVLAVIALILFILALLSHDKMDFSILEGGISGPVNNWIGPTGANISKWLLLLFGLATYPIVALLIICAIRSFLPFPLKRRGYIGSLFAASFGIMILMAMWPADFANSTDALGIGRKAVPELALSGGVVGSFLAAPETASYPAGLIRGYIGTVGTAVAACCLLISGLVFIFFADWKPLISSLVATHAETLKKKIAEAVAERDEIPPVVAPPKPEGKEEKTSATVALPVIKDEDEALKLAKTAPVPVKTEAPSTETVKIADPMEKDDDDDFRPAPPAPLPGQKVAPAVPFAVMPPSPVSTPATAHSPVPLSTHIPRISDDSKDDAYSDSKNEAPAPLRLVQKPSQKAAPKTAPGKELPYTLPVSSLLDKPKEIKNEDSSYIETAKAVLQGTLESFDIKGNVSNSIVGPRVTRYEISLEPGVKVEKVTSITNNIAMNLKAESIRILAPIPGRDAIGVEVPNKVSNIVYIRSLFEADAWQQTRAEIPIILGKDVAGKVIIADLAKAPHLLIAGSTGSGKSVCMNTLIMSLLFKFSPYDLRLIMVDPKFVELEMYRPLPHLITPVVNDPKKVPYALRWGVNEMERRYKLLAKVKSKNLAAFNSRPRDPEPVMDEAGNPIPHKLPILIIIIDELADIMMTEAKGDVETAICRIAQKGRAAGIHLVIATQTPRKDIITGVIKANLPTKIAFKVVSGIDSRVILDTIGAETLLGKGDMLFRGPGGDSLERIQGSMVSDAETQRVVDFVSGQVEQVFDTKVILEEQPDGEENDGDFDDGDSESNDLPPEFANSIAAKYLQPGDSDLVRKGLEIILNENKASTSYLQRRLTIGYNKAAEIIDILEKRGIVSAPLPGGQKRDILVFDELSKPD